MKKINFFLLSSILIVTQGFSQNESFTPATFNTTGGYGISADKYYHIEWSIGEATAIETMESSNISIKYVTNGILQPLSAIPILNDCWGPKEIKIFPNPTTGLIEIDFFSLLAGKVTLSLYDESVRLLEIKQFDYSGFSDIKKMDLSRYPSGAYFVLIRLQPSDGSKMKECMYPVLKFR